MPVFGLIGKKLSHSFSKEYFTNKFQKLGLDSSYELFELDEISDFENLKTQKNLDGLNITIPYKQKIIPYLDEIDVIAQSIGAVNTIKFINGKSIGFNTDYFGFKKSIENFIPNLKNIKALILGDGGASKAIQKVLKDLKVEFSIVSRKTDLSYKSISEDIIHSHKLIINTTPLGMYPEVDESPNIPYQYITKNHFCFDLIYNPEKTQFMLKCKCKEAKVKNGLEMLHLQAEKSWEIWNS